MGIYNRRTCLSDCAVPDCFLVGFCAGCNVLGYEGYKLAQRQITPQITPDLLN